MDLCARACVFCTRVCSLVNCAKRVSPIVPFRLRATYITSNGPSDSRKHLSGPLGVVCVYIPPPFVPPARFRQKAHQALRSGNNTPVTGNNYISDKLLRTRQTRHIYSCQVIATYKYIIILAGARVVHNRYDRRNEFNIIIICQYVTKTRSDCIIFV